jgi:hypothetical protein
VNRFHGMAEMLTQVLVELRFGPVKSVNSAIAGFDAFRIDSTRCGNTFGRPALENGRPVRPAAGCARRRSAAGEAT